MFSKYLKTLSILKKFLFINFVIFTIIGLFTLIYLTNIEPSLLKKKSKDKNYSLCCSPGMGVERRKGQKI